MKGIVITVFVLMFHFLGQAEDNRISRQAYIETYAEVAIQEMKRTGIPASITLAQACLESDNGNSMLAIEARNHFGIKCHKSWTGKTMHKDDDAKDECFRVYNSDLESFKDHSEFLVNGSRYDFLFQLKSSDYEAWAKGLREAGYATNPKYPELLIKIIEENQLHKYDNPDAMASAVASRNSTTTTNKIASYNKAFDKPQAPPPVLIEPNEFTIESPVRAVHFNNRRNYVVVRSGDTFWSIAKEYDLMEWQLPAFNDMANGYLLKVGDILYLQSKRNKADRKYTYHIAKEGETMHSISQLYGVRLKKLYKYNTKTSADTIKVGERIFLRRQSQY